MWNGIDGRKRILQQMWRVAIRGNTTRHILPTSKFQPTTAKRIQASKSLWSDQQSADDLPLRTICRSCVVRNVVYCDGDCITRCMASNNVCNHFVGLFDTACLDGSNDCALLQKDKGWRANNVDVQNLHIAFCQPFGGHIYALLWAKRR